MVFGNRLYGHEYEYVQVVVYLNKDEMRRAIMRDEIRVVFDGTAKTNSTCVWLLETTNSV